MVLYVKLTLLRFDSFLHVDTFRILLPKMTVIFHRKSEDHPPTLFLHGKKDLAVPISTAKAYYEQLLDAGVETDFFSDPDAGHGWLEESADLITDWFMCYL